MGGIRRSFTTYFLKVFITIEFSLLVFSVALGACFAYYVHQEHYDQVKRQARDLSRVFYPHVENQVEAYRFNRVLFAKKIKNIIRDMNIETLFILNAQSIFLFHSNKDYIGQKTYSIYPKLVSQNTFSSNQASSFKDIIYESNNIEYEYVYRYLLGDEINHPIYTTQPFVVHSRKGMSTSIRKKHQERKRQLYIVWRVQPKFLFSWVDVVIGLFLITNISFVGALIFEKKLRQTNRVLQEQINKDADYLVDPPVTSSEDQADLDIPPSSQKIKPQETQKKVRTKTLATSSHQIQAKEQVQPELPENPTQDLSPTKEDIEEIPEAIVLN